MNILNIRTKYILSLIVSFEFLYKGMSTLVGYLMLCILIVFLSYREWIHLQGRQQILKRMTLKSSPAEHGYILPLQTV